MDKIDWKSPENSDEVRRPFSVKVEASVARNFIKAVHHQGLHVRETVVKLMRAFTNQYGPKELDDDGKKSA